MPRLPLAVVLLLLASPAVAGETVADGVARVVLPLGLGFIEVPVDLRPGTRRTPPVPAPKPRRFPEVAPADLDPRLDAGRAAPADIAPYGAASFVILRGPAQASGE